MALIERDLFLTSLQEQFETLETGEGHCVLLVGEAGIGKTALVKAFCKKQASENNIFQGACDALFTPRPLAPLYDVLWQVNKERWPLPPFKEKNSVVFANFFQELTLKKGKLIIIFEDIHWADEATLDFITFFTRRIDQLPCLFILTYREDELISNHPLRNVLGQLPPDLVTKLALTPLSKQAVMAMATQKGYNGEDVYSIAGGNPFYVNEILASYSPGVPNTVKDSILAVFERQKEGTRNAWRIWSVIPEGLEVDRLAKVKSFLGEAIDHCFAISVAIVQNGKVVFKHELYRRTIEESLSPIKRIEINEMLLDLFLNSFQQKGEIERILHYAKNANRKELVAKYAPEAAKKATLINAHKEASKLYLTAIEYFEENDEKRLAELYQAYAYECYLINQLVEATDFTQRALTIWEENAETSKCADCLCLLSRLYWFNGNMQIAEKLALKGITLVKNHPDSSTAAKVFSNLSQLKMLSGDTIESLIWGEKAIELAKKLNDDYILSHAMNNVGAVQMLMPEYEQKGEAKLQKSLTISLKQSYQENAVWAFSNLGSILIRLRRYRPARKVLKEGIIYCEERHLTCLTDYLLSWKARLDLEIGNWADASAAAENLLKNEHQSTVIKINALVVQAKILMRRSRDGLSLMLEAKKLGFETKGLQLILPSMTALLEYEWISGKSIIESNDIERISIIVEKYGITLEKNDFVFWMNKAGRQPGTLGKNSETGSGTSFDYEHCDRAYEQALKLFERKEEDKRKAIAMIHDLGAIAVYEKMKLEMRNLGIKNIPRGIRNSTRSNAALLTGREMDVLQLLKKDLHNKEIASLLYISAKTVDHHISSILFKLDANSRSKAVAAAISKGILK